MKRAAFSLALAALPFGRVAAQTVVSEPATVPDLRFGFAPVPPPQPGFDPAGDAKALIAPTWRSPAAAPIPGDQFLGSYAQDERYVIRIPQKWNGSLVVCGTPGTRSEFANDAIWSDFLLARGFAFASSNKAIPYNIIAEPFGTTDAPHSIYPVPFDVDGLEAKKTVYRIGMLWPARVPIERWNEDFAALVAFAQDLLKDRRGMRPNRTYAVGLSNGGAQVRSLLERYPDAVDGGVDWSAPYWSPSRNLFEYLAPFLAAMPNYIHDGYSDHAIAQQLLAAGYPNDVRQPDAMHQSLWLEYYSNLASFYADLTLLSYALLIDPRAHDDYFAAPFTPNPNDPVHLPGISTGSTGLALPERRAAYTPSSFARSAISAFAQTGEIDRPLLSIAGTLDAFITPDNNARTYATAVALAGRRAKHELYLVQGGTHIDAMAPFGYGIVPQLPFAWAAFDRLVRIVEHGTRPTGLTRVVATPAEVG